jgi:hypothetical protein
MLPRIVSKRKRTGARRDRLDSPSDFRLEPLWRDLVDTHRDLAKMLGADSSGRRRFRLLDGRRRFDSGAREPRFGELIFLCFGLSATYGSAGLTDIDDASGPAKVNAVPPASEDLAYRGRPSGNASTAATTWPESGWPAMWGITW